MFVSWLLLFAMGHSFTASSVLPANESRPQPLQPGMLFPFTAAVWVRAPLASGLRCRSSAGPL